jgi:predicted amidophosphoribosyltransferase
LRRPLDGAVCDACWASIRISRALDERLDASHPISWRAAVNAYEGRMKDIIHALKYDRRRSIAPRLGALMREAGAEMLRDADCVVPVPLHPWREFRRGFNQAHQLAIHLGPAVVPLLKRIVHTRSQIDLPRERRLANVKDAFAIDKPKGLSPQDFFKDPQDFFKDPCDPCGDGPLGPSIVVLVDDVSTTGATLDSCARVLRRSGVKDVRALTAARVVNERR